MGYRLWSFLVMVIVFVLVFVIVIVIVMFFLLGGMRWVGEGREMGRRRGEGLLVMGYGVI